MTGKSTTEKDYPSNKQANKKKDDAANSKVLRGRYAVGWVRCSLPSCGKPRVLFKGTPLDEGQRDAVLQLDENTMYTCGAPVTMAGHQLHGLLHARASLRCRDPVEFAYYHYRSRFPNCCSVCGETGVALTKPEELCQLYRDVLPWCEVCAKKKTTSPPVRYNKKFREAKASRESQAAKSCPSQSCPSRPPANTWDGPMSGDFTLDQVAQFPKTCCRNPCLAGGQITFTASAVNSDESPFVNDAGIVEGAIESCRKCSLCGGLWHDLCCADTDGMPFDADGDGGRCFDCTTPVATQPASGYTREELEEVMDGAFEAGNPEELDDADVELGLLAFNDDDDDPHILSKLRATPLAHFVSLDFQYVHRVLHKASSTDGGAASDVPAQKTTPHVGSLL